MPESVPVREYNEQAHGHNGNPYEQRTSGPVHLRVRGLDDGTRMMTQSKTKWMVNIDYPSTGGTDIPMAK